MGFRNPITSATAVDTGQPGGASARVYEGSDASGTFGVLEFRDGISGDTPSTVTGKANLTPQGGGGYTAQGGSLAMKAGTFNGTPGPELDLLVTPAAISGYEASARLSGIKRLQIDGPVEFTAGNALALPVGAGLVGGTPPTDFQPIIQAGSAVVTAASSGACTINYPIVFPNGVLSVVLTPGDIANNLGELSIYGYRTNGVDISAHVFTGGAAVGVIRINYLAIGW